MRSGRLFSFVALCFFPLINAQNSLETNNPYKIQPDTTNSMAISPTPYALPFLLRGTNPANSLRIEGTYSSYETSPNDENGFIHIYTLSASKKLSPSLAIYSKIAVAHINPNGQYENSIIYSNPLIGVLNNAQLAENFKFSMSLGVTAPIGSGGGNDANSSVRTANGIAQLSRSAMENSLYASNYIAIIPGVDFTYLRNDFQIQFESTLFQLLRVNGERLDKDKYRTNVTIGLGAGYHANAQLSLLSELRYQRWINNDTVEKSTSPAIDNLSLGIGPRFTFKLSKITLKPAISYTQSIYGTLSNSKRSSNTKDYKTITLDLPLIF